MEENLSRNVTIRKVSSQEFYNSYSFFRSECFDLREKEEYLKNSVIDSINLPPLHFDLKIRLYLVSHLITDSPFEIHPIHVYAEQENQTNLELLIKETQKYLFKKNERKFEILILESFDDFSSNYSILCSPKKVVGENLFEDQNKIVFRCLPQRILPNLFLGDFKTSQSESVLNCLNINSIVNASNFDYPTKFNGKEYFLVSVDDFDHVKIDEWFEKVNQFIENKKKLNIHCLVHW